MIAEERVGFAREARVEGVTETTAEDVEAEDGCSTTRRLPR
jgi:hypothetical protein